MKQVETYDNVYAINVDVQNDFCPGGALAVTEGDLVVPPLNAVNEWARNQNGKVIFTADWHPRETAHFAEFGGPWPPHCVRFTTGAAFNNNLIIRSNDNIALKGKGKVDDGYSGWYAEFEEDSPLYRYGELYPGSWREPGVSTVKEAALDLINSNKTAVIIGGLATDYCVKATVLDVLETRNNAEKTAQEFGIFVVRDAIKAVDINPGDGDKAIEEMEEAGAIFVTSEEVLNGVIQVAA